MITLEKVTEKNYVKCLKLKVKETQKNFVATNAVSLAQAYVYSKTAKPFVILENKTVVGFIMFEVDKDKDEYSVWRFMIDHVSQGKGYGKKALMLGIDYLVELGAKKITLSHVPGNMQTSQLYLDCGFVYTGTFDGEEKVMEYLVK